MKIDLKISSTRFALLQCFAYGFAVLAYAIFGKETIIGQIGFYAVMFFIATSDMQAISKAKVFQNKLRLGAEVAMGYGLVVMLISYMSMKTHSEIYFIALVVIIFGSAIANTIRAVRVVFKKREEPIDVNKLMMMKMAEIDDMKRKAGITDEDSL